MAPHSGRPPSPITVRRGEPRRSVAGPATRTLLAISHTTTDPLVYYPIV